jgi:dTDP-4-dehydrorhamnose 3,5-epimerase
MPVTAEFLKSLDLRPQKGRNPTIEGVMIRDLIVNLDGRGEVTELWSVPWFKDGVGPVEHVYQSATDQGVVKAWHLHEVHTDQFVVTRGKLQVVLVDVRPSSESFGHVNVLFVGVLNPRLIKIPPGILHGWKALTGPEVIVTNLQSHVYDPVDELKFNWT